MNGQPRYQAFISYSHADQKIARWLQKSLERYSIPKSLVGREHQRGLIPAHLRPVFRDTEDLGSSPQLSDTLEQALRDSAALLVLCSPSANDSVWLSREVQAFIEMGREQDIFAVIVDGDPAEPINELLPPLLRGSEPLAADLRPGFDGRRRGRLKVVAGLLGVGLDSLIRRHLQRQQRIFLGAGVLSLILVTAMAGLWYNAAVARDEAILRRGQAEDLIGFMLTDLRAKLDPLGRLDVLDDVGNEAMAFFATVDDRDDDLETVRKRILALRQIGEVRLFQNRLVDAEPALTEALTQAHQAVANDPANTEVQFELSQVHFWLGYLHWLRGELDESNAQFESYLAVATNLSRLEPENLEWQAEMAYAYENIGTVNLRLRNFPEAQKALASSISMFTDILDSGLDVVDYRQELANLYSWLGSVHVETGSIALAAGQYELALTTLKSLDQSSWDVKEQTADNTMLLAHLSYLGGKLSQASEHSVKARAIFQSLVDHDSGNQNWRSKFAMSQFIDGLVLVDSGRIPAAERMFFTAYNSLMGVYEAGSSNEDIKRNLLEVGTAIAELALESERDALSDWQNFAAPHIGEEEMDGSDRRLLATARIVAGKIYRQQGDDAAALHEWSRAEELLDQEQMRLDTLSRQVELFELLGQVERAAQGREKLVSLGYGRRPTAGNQFQQ